ncbi:MAG: STAS domain-containing protein [Rubrivivax sp.]|nr:STAS domain-containing protein [Rubrivivax sp.]MDP3086025.1 STAS domain-containing protein [Rubrivivax sp.]
MPASAALPLPATATMAEASGLLRQIEAHAAAGGDGPLRIDASALQEFDTAVVALLLAAQRLARQQGRELALEDAPAKLMQLAGLYGVESLLSPGKAA